MINKRKTKGSEPYARQVNLKPLANTAADPRSDRHSPLRTAGDPPVHTKSGPLPVESLDARTWTEHPPDSPVVVVVLLLVTLLTFALVTLLELLEVLR